LPVTSISKKNLPEWNGIEDGKKPAKQGADKDKKSAKRKRKDDKKDDMPRAFKRLMAFADGKKPRAGLDDGIEPPKKKKQQKKGGDATGEAAEGGTPAKQVSAKDARPEIPTIRPGERLSEYAQRVDAALPLSGLVTKTVKDGKDPLGLKVARTRKERKMHKLYDQWREEERKIQEKREEEAELAEEEEMENETAGVKWKMDMEDEMASRKKKTKGKKGTRYLGEVKEKEEDPWEELKKKRAEPKIGLHDVAAAPPELIKVNPKLLVRGAQVNVGDIPKSAGSLRQREELQAQRDDVVAAYRKLMSEKRPAFGPTHNYRRT
jgi:hypothetical protein